MRPFRSVLYMPGSNARALEKAKTLPADALILDMEDAVAPDAKAQARALIAGAVNSQEYQPRYVLVRVNGLDTEWGADDIAAMSDCKPDAILLPKVNGPSDIHAALALMDACESLRSAEIWAMIETPAGVLAAGDIASASERVGGFVLGTNDLVKDMRAQYDPSRLAVTAALSQSVMAARAAGIAVVDGVYNSIKDQAGFQAECTQGRILGFDGKSLIHPSQVEIANDTFGPSEEDLDEARRFVAAFDEALANGKAVAVVGGRLVENLHVENAKRMLAMAESIETLTQQAGAA